MYNLISIKEHMVVYKMNKKGFAISSILYILILIVGLLFATTLGLLTFRKGAISSRINTITSELGGGYITQYRYMTANGEWSNWLDYKNKDDINYSFPITNIPNLGTAGSTYDLTPTNITLDIVDGEAYLKFNGSSSKAISTDGQLVVANTIILEVKKDNNGAIVSYNIDTQQGIYYDSSNKLRTIDNIGETQVSTPSYSNGNIYKYVLILNKVNGTYKIYQNGAFVGVTGSSNIARITSIGLGHFKHNNSGFFSGNIYRAIFSSALISDEDAINISKIDGDPNYENIINAGNANIKYGPFIEYRNVLPKNKLISNDTFKTRYIQDFMNGTLTLENNQILEIEAYAKFDSGVQFHGIMVGGTFNGTYTKDKDKNGVTTLGKIRISVGDFTHINTKNFFLGGTPSEIVTPFTTADSVGSGLLAFVGSDLTRFTINNPFLYVEYSDRNATGKDEWYYYDGTSWHIWTPNKNDAIVGYITKLSGQSTSHLVEMFASSFSFNIALGKKINSNYGTTDPDGKNISIIVDGNKQSANYFTNGTSNKYVEIDLGVEYDIAKVKVFHQYTTAPVTTLGTKTILYNYDKSKKDVLWDYNDKGLYIEETTGKGITFYVDRNRMPNTHKTRYIRDDCGGNYDASGSYSGNSTWVEIEAYDYNGYNIARSKTVTGTGSSTNIAYVTDGNTVNLYNAGVGVQSVTIDLEVEYAIKEVNVMHHTENRTYLGTQTLLLNNDSDSNNIIYYYKSDGSYKEKTNGLRIANKTVISGHESDILPIPSLPEPPY